MAVIDRVLVGEALVIDNRPDGSGLDLLNVAHIDLIMGPRGSAAEEAGLRGAKIERDGGIVPGDIILAVDGKPVDTVSKLVARLDEKKPGDTVKLTIHRDGNQAEVSATLKSAS